MSAAKSDPFTWADVAYPVAFTSENPVMNDVAAGLRPMFPVTLEVGTFETADFARIT